MNAALKNGVPKHAALKNTALKNGVGEGEEEASLARAITACANDPLRFVETVFPWGQGALSGEPGPDAWQRELLASVRDSLAAGEKPLRMAVASGHGVGKTALSAWLLLWFMLTRDHPQVVVTANTAAQLRNKTWRELAKWHRLARNKHWFEWTATRFTSPSIPKPGSPPPCPGPRIGPKVSPAPMNAMSASSSTKPQRLMRRSGM